MKKIAIYLLVILTFSLPLNIAADYQGPSSYEFRNGRWFDGKSFVVRTFYSVRGRLTSKRPARPDSVIDLTGKYVIPPLAEAHNHNLGGANGLDAQIAMYLRDGVFYSKNLHYVRDFTSPILGRVNTPSSVDVAYAHGGLVARGGHAVELYEKLYDRGVFRGWKKEDLDTKAFFIIDDEDDLARKWPLILAGKPDFIKTYLEYSEQYEKRRNDPRYYGHRGLNPTLLKSIVMRAHKAGLRVSTHVESAADFHNALVAGVDEIAHLPGYHIPAGENVLSYRISDEDARLARRKNIFVVTTTLLSVGLTRNDPQRLAVIQDNQIHNLRTLAKFGVKIALGSDTMNATSLAEVLNIHALKVFDNLTLLKLLCENTPQTIFPDRKIGFLKDGYEASFLALEGNPLDDFMNVQRIGLRFKQGAIIHLDPDKKQ